MYETLYSMLICSLIARSHSGWKCGVRAKESPRLSATGCVDLASTIAWRGREASREGRTSRSVSQHSRVRASCRERARASFARKARRAPPRGSGSRIRKNPTTNKNPPAEIFLRARKAHNLGWDDESLPGTNASPFEALTIGAGGGAACRSFTSARVIRRRVRTSKGLMAAPSSAPTAARVTEDCIARRGMCALFPRRAPATGARFAPTA